MNKISLVPRSLFLPSGLLTTRPIKYIVEEPPPSQPWLKRQFDQKIVWQKAQSTINRQGWWAILLTRFWLTPLAPAINVIAGSRYPFLRFLFFDLLGQFLWVLLYGGLGYFFATQWERVSQAISAFSGLSIGLILLTFGTYFLLLRFKYKE